MQEMEKRIISSIRSLSIDMINTAGSGHPGICLGAAPIIYTLFSKHLNSLPSNPKWINRDRFIMSAGHGSALLYSTLFLSGYPIKLEELNKFRQLNSRLTGHPELNTNIGVECTTGPLGEGLATAVGMAIGEEYLRNNISNEIFDHYTYVLATDGDLMEGISYEAASLAGSLSLGKLIVLYDSNNITLDGGISGIFNENILQRFESMGWHTQVINNAEDINYIDKAIIEAKEKTDKPSLILVKSIIGYGSELAGTNKVHGKPLAQADIIKLKESLNVNAIPYKIAKEPVEKYRNDIKLRVVPNYNNWVNKYKELIKRDTKLKNNLLLLEQGFRINLNNLTITKPEEELRDTNNRIMNIISKSTPLFLGGSADVASSTKTLLAEEYFKINNTYGKNICYGVRENAMAAITNGLSLLGLKAFCSTFLTFSDYMKPSLRLASLMKIPSIFVFTHDSISIGQDGPTHQPIEQIGALRSIPNMTVFRPADVREILGSWNYALNSKTPTSIIISRDKLPTLDYSNSEQTNKGAYIVYNENGKLDGIIIATGSEVSNAINIAKDIEQKGSNIRVVSMPSMEVFEKQPEEYKKEIIEPFVNIVTLEASNDSNWYRYVSNNEGVININTFGVSAKKEDVLKEMSFDYQSLLQKVEHILK